MTDSILTPALALICWTLVMWLWMYATRIPAMQKAKINPRRNCRKNPRWMSCRRKSAALRIITTICTNSRSFSTRWSSMPHWPDPTQRLMVYAAWIYVALRIAHSLIQALWNFIPVRFLAVFMLSSLVLLFITAINVGYLLGS